MREALGYLGSFPGPALLVGDFNARPDAAGMLDLAGAGWTDAWALLRPGEDGSTFESDRPRERIDYVRARPPLERRLRAAFTIGGGLCSAAVRLSNHLGLLVDLAPPPG